MNSKLLFLLLISFVGCGVKGDPVYPKDPPFPSVLQNYPEIKVDEPLNETKRR